MEQIEYEAENIEWSFVSFPDNQDCLDLIENKKKSIFRLLDDECMLAGGTDEKFASRMIKELGEYSRLSVSTVQRIDQQFCIHHYAGEVVYSTKTFLVRPCYAAS
jgi:myosin-5